MPAPLKPDLLLKRATNGFVVDTLTGDEDRLPTIATTVDDLLDHVRAWAEPQKPSRSRKH